MSEQMPSEIKSESNISPENLEQHRVVETPEGFGLEGVTLSPDSYLEIKRPGIKRSITEPQKYRDWHGKDVIGGLPLVRIDMGEYRPGTLDMSYIVLDISEEPIPEHDNDEYSKRVVGIHELKDGREIRANYVVVELDEKGRVNGCRYLDPYNLSVGLQYIKNGRDALAIDISEEGSIAIINGTKDRNVRLREIQQNLTSFETKNEDQRMTGRGGGNYTITPNDLRPLTNSDALSVEMGVNGDALGVISGGGTDTILMRDSEGVLIATKGPQRSDAPVIERLTPGTTTNIVSKDDNRDKRSISMSDNGQVSITESLRGSYNNEGYFKTLNDVQQNHYQYTPPYTILKDPRNDRAYHDDTPGLLARDPYSDKIYEYKNGQYRDTGQRY